MANVSNLLTEMPMAIFEDPFVIRQMRVMVRVNGDSSKGLDLVITDSLNFGA